MSDINNCNNINHIFFFKKVYDSHLIVRNWSSPLLLVGII